MNLSPEAYILLSVAALGLVLTLGASLTGRPKAAAPPPQAEGRWRRFRIEGRPLHGALEKAALVVAEEPGGLELEAAPRASGDPVRVLGTSGRPAVTISRGWLFPRRLRVRIDGRQVLSVAARKGPRGPGVSIAHPGGEPFEAHGSIASGEYEVRRGGRLIAMAFRVPETGGRDPIEEDWLEVLKDEDPLPVVALALAVELTGGLRG